MSEVFISYVREDERYIQFLCEILELNGIKVWTDKTRLQPGTQWKVAIESAIKNGIYFLSVHSKARASKSTSYANEELHVALDEYRKRPPSTQWLIPLIIDDCDIEDWRISGALNYSDIQRCDLRNWGVGIDQLLDTLGVTNKIVDLEKPIAKGLPSFVKIQSGFVHYDHIDQMPPYLSSMEHRVKGGWCQRKSSGIIAYFELKAPLEPMEKLNRLLGYTGFHSFCLDAEISSQATHPSTFVYDRSLVAPRGMETIDFSTGRTVALPFDMPFRSTFEAQGHIDGLTFKGQFSAQVQFEVMGAKQIHNSNGHFEILFGPDRTHHPLDRP